MDLNNQIIIYQTEDGQTQVDVRMENDMIWLTRQQIAVLFGRDYKTISKHINNALKEELADSVVVAKFANTTQHGAIEGKTQTLFGNILNSLRLSKHDGNIEQLFKVTFRNYYDSLRGGTLLEAKYTPLS